MIELNAGQRAWITLLVFLAFVTATVVLRATGNDAGFFQDNLPLLMLFLLDTGAVAIKHRKTNGGSQ